MTRDEFEDIVIESVDNLPEEFAKALENVGIVIEDWPSPYDLKSLRVHSGMTLFGLYRGVPKTKRGSHYSALPDKIIIFMGPILRHFPDPEQAKRQIRATVLHEIGHHFGMSEEQIRKAQSKH